MLSTHVLSQANSPFYGLSGRVTSVAMAMQVLGLKDIRQMCLAVGLGQLLRASKIYQRAEGQVLWRHSLYSAEAAGLLAQERGVKDSEIAFAGGLLHDLGKVLLAASFPLAYQSVRQIVERRQNLDHQKLGWFLAQRWGLPPLLEQVIDQHHQSSDIAKFDQRTALTHLADSLAQSLKQDEMIITREGQEGQVWEAFCQALGMQPEYLKTSLKRLRQRLTQLDFT